jgi:hypothetical protein
VLVNPGGSPVSVLPCPCCGSTDLHVGATAALWLGVSCQQCGLRMEREVANRRTKRTLRELEAWTLRQAIDAWNCRRGES